MGLDARRGTGFSRSGMTTCCEDGKPSANDGAKSISQAAGERLGDRQSLSPPVVFHRLHHGIQLPRSAIPMADEAAKEAASLLIGYVGSGMRPRKANRPAGARWPMLGRKTD